jgi:membrane protease subunit HflK
MRAVIANVTLDGAMGEQRGQIEARVAEEMQTTLNAYGAGVLVQGVSLRQADPPAAVNEAFKAVTAAQQAAQSDINQANAYALQLRQIAEGEATAFNKVYEQYRLAPEVTRRRMYYETMERVLRNVDKTIVETPGVTPYLPLNQIGRSIPAPAPAPQGGGQ